MEFLYKADGTVLNYVLASVDLSDLRRISFIKVTCIFNYVPVNAFCA